MKKSSYILIALIILGIAFFIFKSNQAGVVTSQPTPVTKTALPGEHCGGNMTTALACGAGYHCAPTPGSHLPFGDVGGTCVKN